MNAGRPPFCRYSFKMSGVFGHKLGRKKSLTGGSVISVKYSVSSAFVFFHAKYVYDCVNPNFANRYITLGRVNASARKMASGYSRCVSRMSHYQNANGFVCGLSTRKILMPCEIQNKTTLFNSSASAT